VYRDASVSRGRSALIFNAILERAPVAPVRLNPDVPDELERSSTRLWKKTGASAASLPQS
jgi:hypothetical protein